jgi:hypothetical protein
MPDTTSMTIRKTSEEDFQKAKLEYEHKKGKKIKVSDFLDFIIKKFREAITNDNQKNI